MVVENCSNCLNQLITASLESRKDDSHILCGQPRVLWWENWLEGPERCKIHNKAKIAVNTVNDVSVIQCLN